MSDSDFTTTPHLGLIKPNYSRDNGQWGYHLNTNADVLDGILGAPDSPFLRLAGGIMDGPLTLAGNATQPLQAVPLQQVNSTAAGGPFLPLGGGAMGGPLTLAGNATQAFDAVPLQQVNSASTGGPFLPLGGGTLSGPLMIGTGASATTAITQAATNVQPTADHIYNQFQNVVSYTANGTNGDSLGIVSYMGVRANGHSVPNTASQHTTAIYGNGYLDNDGNAASSVDRVSGVMGVVGNSGPGTLTNGMAIYGHPNYNTGGGHITNSYFLFEEPSSAAQNHYNYLSAPLGMGITAPQYNLDINMQGGGNINFNNALRIDFSANGTFLVGRNGASFYPGYNPGPGGLGVTDMVVGFNGQPNATNATTSFLYISACPGPPTAGPALAAAGRVALTFDTVTHKLWANDGSGWRGVVLT